MTEPDVTLTDYALAVECAVFAVLLRRRGRPGVLHRWWVGFFAAASAAPLLGGTVHGFFRDPSSSGYVWLWPATLLAIGTSAFCAYAIGGTLLFGEHGRRRVQAGAAVLLALYGVVVLSGFDAFWIAIVAYVPAVLLLTVAFGLTYRRRPERPIALATAGLALTLLAAALQQARVGIHPVYFNHNALYHAIQGLALLAIFWGARHLIAPKPGDPPHVDATSLP